MLLSLLLASCCVGLLHVLNASDYALMQLGNTRENYIGLLFYLLVISQSNSAKKKPRKTTSIAIEATIVQIMNEHKMALDEL